MYCFCKVYSIHLHNNDVAFHDLIAFLSSEYSQSALLPAFFMHEKSPSLRDSYITYVSLQSSKYLCTYHQVSFQPPILTVLLHE